MAHVYADRVLETSVTTGTGPMILTGALTGFRTFASVLTGGDTIDYAIQAVDDNGVPTGAWETGRGTYSAPGQLLRSTLHASSTGAFIDWGAGTKQVMLTQTAQSVRTLVKEAPADGNLYVRKDASWTPVALEGAQNTTPYGKRTQWRIRTTAVAGGSARYCVVAELSFRGPDGQPIPATGGTAIGTIGDAGREPAKAFDGDPLTSYASTPSISGSPGGIALGYSFPAPVEVGAVTVQVGSNLQDTPTAFTVEYYDGAAWVPAWSVTKAWTPSEVATFTTPHLIPPYNTKVPAGGAPGQVLAKSSAANGDTTWTNSLNEAPADGKLYVRKDAGWTPIVIKNGGRSAAYRGPWGVSDTVMRTYTFNNGTLPPEFTVGTPGTVLVVTNAADAAKGHTHGMQIAMASSMTRDVIIPILPTAAMRTAVVRSWVSSEVPDKFRIRQGAVELYAYGGIQSGYNDVTVQLNPTGAQELTLRVTSDPSVASGRNNVWISEVTLPVADPDFTYLAGDSVQHNGAYWLCVVAGTPDEPGPSAAGWTRIGSVVPQPLVVALTQAAYDALPAVDPNALYFITG